MTAAASILARMLIISPIVLAVLVVVLLAASAMFFMLVRRSTRDRQWLTLKDFADRNRFIARRGEQAIRPSVLEQLQPRARVTMSLHDVDTMIVRTEFPDAPPRPVGWNLLVRTLQTEWPVTVLRPASRAHSIADFLPLEQMYLMSPGERFVLYGANRPTAAALDQSIIRGLLPADVGLVLMDRHLILDFSTRPFDALEMQRIDALAEQVIAHLPGR